MRRPVSLRRQAGQTLISMMVGLVISLLTIGAMLAVYKMMIDVSRNASGASIRDGQVSLAMLAAQIEMQQAGFGIDEGDGPVLAVTGGGADEDYSRVVWRYQGSGAAAGTVCGGVEIVRKAQGAKGSGARQAGMYAMSPSACADPQGWVPETYSLLASEEAMFVPTDRNGHALTDEVGANLLRNVRFVHLDGSAADGCSLPYAQQLGAGPSSQRVVLLAGDGDGADILFSVCLPNVAAAAAGEAGSEPDEADVS